MKPEIGDAVTHRVTIDSSSACQHLHDFLLTIRRAPISGSEYITQISGSAEDWGAELEMMLPEELRDL